LACNGSISLEVSCNEFILLYLVNRKNGLDREVAVARIGATV
jgi:hypothetical protein